MNDHELYKEIMFAAEQMYFDEAEEAGFLKTDGYCVIMHPKHKSLAIEFFKSFGPATFPILYSFACKEDKFYVVTDPYLVKQAKEILEKEKPHERDLIDQFREAFNKVHGIEEDKE